MSEDPSSAYVFTPAPQASVAIAGRRARFPVHRIYCVARNYPEHAREMGSDPDREPPFFFGKPADALVPAGSPVPYPPRCADFHHEVELVVALGAGGSAVAAEAAEALIFGYGIGIDWTRRDLQAVAKKSGRPWDTAKGFDGSATLELLHTVDDVGHLRRGAIWLEVNGVTRQRGDLADMIWSVPEIIAELSTLYALRAGDLIYTGTPAGVAAVARGDRLRLGVDGLDEITTSIRT